jgi:hypothetical protein
MLAIFFISGCAGYRGADLHQTDRGIKHSDVNFSLLQGSIGPTEMSQAKINLAIADQIQKGQTAEFAGGYTGVIKNLETSKSFYFYHPSRDAMITIPPGEYKPIKSTDIPDYIFGKFSGERKIESFRIYKKTKVYNGIKTDFGCQVEF